MLPTLTTARLVLRAPTVADHDALWRHWTVPQVRRYLLDDAVIDEAASRTFIEDCAALNPRGLGLWLIASREGALLGHLALLPETDLGRENAALAGDVEFGISLAPQAWGQGYAGEALRAVLDHGTGAAGLQRILGVADEPNHASRRLQERAGFTFLCHMPGKVFPLIVSQYRKG